MKRVRACLIATAFAMMFISSSAKAETLLTPWIGANSGGPLASGAVDFGGGVGVTLGGVIGADFDVSYSPSFFGANLNSYVLTTMGNVTVGIPLGGTSSTAVRPYVTGGLGLIRAHIDGTRPTFSVGSNDLGVNFGGGIIGFFGEHVGVRGDLRYIQSVHDDDATFVSSPLDLDRLHYWRTSFGIVIR